MDKTLLEVAASGILVVHAGWVVFLGAGFLWVRGFPWGERAHLGALGMTLALELSGAPCPLTVAEIALRTRGDAATVYQGSCIPHYLGNLFPQVPWGSVQVGGEVFLVVLALWWYGRIPRGLRLDHRTRAA